MKRLLINGCSFGKSWTPSTEFIESLGCDDCVNISKVGTSFHRTCRSTVEWIAQNGDPHFVVIPITFWSRWEWTVSAIDDQIDGLWFPIQRAEYLESDPKEETVRKVDPDVDKDKLKKLIEYFNGISPTIRGFWDKLFTEAVLLSGFLDAHKVDYLMFDMCNEFDGIHLSDYKGFEKLKLLEENKKVIDLFNFCGNRYMWNSLENKEKIDYNIHHAPAQYRILEKYLLRYKESIRS